MVFFHYSVGGVLVQGEHLNQIMIAGVISLTLQAPPMRKSVLNEV